MISKKLYSDCNYKDAINYDGTNYYNFPMTIEKEGVKFILPFGTSDLLTIIEDNPIVYIVGENEGLNYISLFVIYPDNSTGSAYLDSEGCDTSNIFEYSIKQQIKILSEYLN